MLLVDPQTYDMTIEAGDQEKIKFTLTDSTGAAYNATSCAFSFVAKASLDDAIGAALINVSTGANPTQWDLALASTGIIVLTFLPANTNLLGGRRLVYGLKMTDALSAPHTPRVATMVVRKNPVV